MPEQHWDNVEYFLDHIHTSTSIVHLLFCDIVYNIYHSESEINIHLVSAMFSKLLEKKIIKCLKSEIYSGIFSNNFRCPGVPVRGEMKTKGMQKEESNNEL